MKFIKVLFLATIACFGAVACTTSAPEDNCKEASYDNIMCDEYSRDDCGNIICAPPSSSDSKKFHLVALLKVLPAKKVKQSLKPFKNPENTLHAIPSPHTCANLTNCRQTTLHKMKANLFTNRERARLLTSGILTRGQRSPW